LWYAAPAANPRYYIREVTSYCLVESTGKQAFDKRDLNAGILSDFEEIQGKLTQRQQRKRLEDGVKDDIDRKLA
jgi:hypothetical protein